MVKAGPQCVGKWPAGWPARWPGRWPGASSDEKGGGPVVYTPYDGQDGWELGGI